MRFVTLALSCAAVCWHANAALAELKLPAVFSDAMVLQRNQPVHVWGWANAGSQIRVRIANQSHDATTNGDGRWDVMLTSLDAGGPLKMEVSGDGGMISLSNILVGEVWLCSGQSNMAMTVAGVQNAEDEIAGADIPTLRMFTVRSGHSTQPQADCQGKWINSHPNSVGSFSATAYFFGKRLHEELQVPIGLINSSVGGTSIESWTSLSAQQAVPEISPRLAAWENDDRTYEPASAKVRYEKQLEAWVEQKTAAEQAGRKPPRRPQLAVQPSKDRNYPSNLFNGKIHPLVGYTIKGAIWYQGENSAGRGFANLYGVQLRTLIDDWRTRWGQGEFPFAWVQLPNFRAEQKQPSESSGWVEVQEGMLRTLAVPNTGMAITVDVGEANDIHPRNKQAVGSRLAQWALATQYGKNLVPMGPTYRSASVKDNRMIISFDHVGDGLRADKELLDGFAIAGPDHRFVWADARIDGDKVVVWHDDIAKPQSVRYAWASNPKISLYNSANLPASPFRTDDWEVADAE
ncbi:MAG: sialate O-acetylesterase [Planctomycetaceae bacterium]|nr:sialate O-acetylesterase [Planctomycetaceae bacterium]